MDRSESEEQVDAAPSGEAGRSFGNLTEAVPFASVGVTLPSFGEGSVPFGKRFADPLHEIACFSAVVLSAKLRPHMRHDGRLASYTRRASVLYSST